MYKTQNDFSELETTFDSLVRYVNRRAHVVRTDQPTNPKDTSACHDLIGRYIWTHRELISDFVAQNPDGLATPLLNIATALSDSLYGTLYLERLDEGIATILHETGVYRAFVPQDASLPCAPGHTFELRGALAPFHSTIVVIAPLTVMGEVSDATLGKLRAHLADQGLINPTSDAQVLTSRTRAWMARERLRRHEDEPCPIDQLGKGFHRGILTGLSLEQRKRSQVAFDCQKDISARYEAILNTICFDVDTCPVTLEEALLLLDTDWIGDIALELADQPLPPSLPRKGLVRWIRTYLAHHPAVVDSALLWALDEQFELVGRLMHTNPLKLDTHSPGIIDRLYPMIPYVFLLREDGITYAWMPPEVRELITKESYASAKMMRKRLAEAQAAARMLATMCGIVSMSQAYERYRRVVDNPLDRSHFEQALDELEYCESRDDYALWRHMSTDYVISVEIADASAEARVVRECYASHILSENAQGTPDDPVCVALSVEDEGDFARRIAQKERELEQIRVSLLSLDRTFPPHDLTPAMLQSNPVSTLMELGALQALRSFVDAHIPDGEDDYTFADTFCRSVIVSAVLMHEPYHDTMDIIRLYGMEDCDGTGYSDNLGRLVTNAYNALPRWELNGWSLDESTERLTGRRRFFNPDGTVRTLADGDPCPCGSGKPYSTCCGNLLAA